MSNNTQVAQFSESEVMEAIAQVEVVGKTQTEKRLSVINQADSSVRLLAANQTGKIGKAARDGLFEAGLAGITRSASNGRYAPLAQALSLITASNVSISNKASFESLEDRYQPQLTQLKEEGKYFNKGGEKLTSKASQLVQCLSLIMSVREGIAAIKAQSDAE